MYNFRQPTKKQIKLANSLGIITKDKSFRVLTAEIADKIELDSFKYIEQMHLKSGLEVKYVGNRVDFPRYLTISSIGKNGFIYFKGTLKYCRPWNIKIKNSIF
jgi:hypothetical protein